MKVLGNLKEGLFFVISAPSATGKTTLVRKLVEEFSSVVESVSYTTRPMRAGEIEGLDYRFISKEAFQKMIKDGSFLEYAELFDNYYGTSRKDVETLKKQGKHVLLVIDTQGAMQVRERENAVYIFIAPPSLEELKLRMEKRKRDEIEEQKKRLAFAKKELSFASHYDYLIVNKDLSTSYDVLRSILIAEEHKIKEK